MLRPNHLFSFVHSSAARRTAAEGIPSTTVLFTAIAFIALLASSANAQARPAYETPLHVARSAFEFVASGDSQPPTRALAVHNGGTKPLTDLRLTKITYADSAQGKSWLVALPRQTSVAPDELATVMALCIDANGLRAGTYHAKAAVVSREAPQPVEVTIRLVVTDAQVRAGKSSASCNVSPSSPRERK